MPAAIFMLGTVVVEGGLVLLVMWLLTARDREVAHEEEAQRRLTELEAQEEQLRTAA